MPEGKIILKSVGRPQGLDSEDLIRWFCRVFDLSEGSNSLEPKLLKEVVINNFEGSGITSKQLYKKLSAPRSTIIYHLNRLIDVGIVVRKGRKYYLRSSDMQGTIEEMQADIVREFQRLEEYAERFDALLEASLYGREKGRRLRSPEKR